MPRKIFKYQLKNKNAPISETIQMPTFADIKSVQIQDDKITIWADVHPDNPMMDYKFLIIGTGHGEVPKNSKYLATLIDGAYVWHVYVANQSTHVITRTRN